MTSDGLKRIEMDSECGMRIMKMQLPSRMSEVVDDLSPGAYLKRMSDDARAIVVDYIDKDGSTIKGTSCWIVAMVKEKFREAEYLLLSCSDYEIVEITDTDEWIVLTKGNDLDLVE